MATKYRRYNLVSPPALDELEDYAGGASVVASSTPSMYVIISYDDTIVDAGDLDAIATPQGYGNATEVSSASELPTFVERAESGSVNLDGSTVTLLSFPISEDGTCRVSTNILVTTPQNTKRLVSGDMAFTAYRIGAASPRLLRPYERMQNDLQGPAIFSVAVSGNNILIRLRTKNIGVSTYTARIQEIHG
jgi:hypothetical protein